MISTTAADYRRVLRVIGALDVIPNQVLIEATIAEITLKDDLKFGLRWFRRRDLEPGRRADAQAAKTVLGDFLAVEYTLDPGLDGKITLQTPGLVSKAAAVDLFQSALRSNKAAMIYAGGSYKIVPIDQANAGASLRVEGEPDPNGRLGSGVRVVPLKYVNASEIRRILDPISPRGAIVSLDASRNTITLSGNEDPDRRAHVGARSLLSGQWGRPYVYVFPGQHGNPYDIVSLGSDGQEGGTQYATDVVSWQR